MKTSLRLGLYSPRDSAVTFRLHRYGEVGGFGWSGEMGDQPSRLTDAAHRAGRGH